MFICLIFLTYVTDQLAMHIIGWICLERGNDNMLWYLYAYGYWYDWLWHAFIFSCKFICSHL